MIRVEISEAADADLVEILAYGTGNFGLERAEAYVAGFQATFDLISRHPLAGAIHDEVRPPVRSLPHGSHRVFYDVFESEAVVQRILHKAADVTRHTASRESIRLSTKTVVVLCGGFCAIISSACPSEIRSKNRASVIGANSIASCFSSVLFPANGNPTSTT